MVAYFGWQVAPQQALVVLATCHCDPGELPPALGAFFGSVQDDGDVRSSGNFLLDCDLPHPPELPAAEEADVQHALAGSLYFYNRVHLI